MATVGGFLKMEIKHINYFTVKIGHKAVLKNNVANWEWLSSKLHRKKQNQLCYRTLLQVLIATIK
jgi:hypothetical protein